MFQNDNPLVGLVAGDDVAINAFCLFAEPFDEGGAIEDFALGLGKGFAHFDTEDLAKVIGVLDHQIEPFAQDCGAFLACLCCPVLLGVICYVNGAAHIFDWGVGHLGDNFSGRGVANREAIGAVDPLAANERAGFQECGIIQFHGVLRVCVICESDRQGGPAAQGRSTGPLA